MQIETKRKLYKHSKCILLSIFVSDALTDKNSFNQYFYQLNIFDRMI